MIKKIGRIFLRIPIVWYIVLAGLIFYWHHADKELQRMGWCDKKICLKFHERILYEVNKMISYPFLKYMHDTEEFNKKMGWGQP